MIAIGAGGAVAAAAAAAIFFGFRGDDEPSPEQAAVCLLTPFDMVEGADSRCFTSDQLVDLRSRRVIDTTGEPARVSLVHPTDFSAPPRAVETCADFLPLAEAGWGGLSSRDMRREQRFQRACGALELLLRAERPGETFFENGRLSRADFESLGPDGIARLAPDAARLSSDALAVVDQEDGGWSLQVAETETVVKEIAHADFDGDGLGDVLFSAQARASEGSLSTAFVGYFSKTAQGGPVTVGAD